MKRPIAWTLDEVALLVGGKVIVDRPGLISGAAGIESAGPGDVTFYENARFLSLLKASKARAVIVNAAIDDIAPAQIQVDGRPYLRFIKLVAALHPASRPAPGIHPTACVDTSAEIADSVTVGPLSVIGQGATVGARTIIGPHAYVGSGAVLGEDCHIFPRVVIRGACHLGDRVLVHCGAVLGDDGFGYVRDGDRHVKIPHVGRVLIEDDVEIGAGTTIDRATFGETTIGAGSKIDNLVMIAHNVHIGKRCILAAQVGIAGSSSIGDDSILAGQVGVASGSTVGKQVIAGAQSGITGTVQDGRIVSGYPAGDHRSWRRSVAAFWRLPEILARLRAIEHRRDRDRTTTV